MRVSPRFPFGLFSQRFPLFQLQMQRDDIMPLIEHIAALEPMALSSADE
jgi:hypothetical protein